MNETTGPQKIPFPVVPSPGLAACEGKPDERAPPPGRAVGEGPSQERTKAGGENGNDWD